MDRIVRFALAPLLLAQALRTRKTALILPEAAGPRAGQAGTGPRLRLLVLGDSSAAGVGVDHQDQALSGHLVRALSTDFSVEWQLLASTGATSSDALSVLPQATPLDVAVLALGVNDVTRLTSPQRFVHHQRQLLQGLRDRGARLICVTAIPPMGEFPLLPNPLRWTLGRHASRLQQMRAAHLADFAGYHPLDFDLPPDPALMPEDGFHPGPEVYRLWAQTAAQTIRTHWTK
ncbi:SGNH/GDSL hydrolase family protein [Thalassobius vesicularis]|uniref:SGNH/GDSL hydrolase family protein n=1 Tax=Thalassobius vesicularis TaxID=1294297 RepID=A0A4S3MC18_9RHOB|nr:SGNH/GDSL hydrolase family protein [Thalassobius vesicularis]THD75926.1 SGNH/GDSL hydrolase family protein [Thalassobius vesicularis]